MVWWRGHHGTVIRRFAFWLRPCSGVPMFIPSRVWWCGSSYGHMVKHWTMWRFMAFSGCNYFPRELQLCAFLPYLHQNPSTICNFILVFWSQAQLHQWLCLLCHPLVSAALLSENQCAFLFERRFKQWWKVNTGHSRWRAVGGGTACRSSLAASSS